MDHTVRQHVEWLEKRQQVLNTALMATNTRDQANSIETEIRAVRLALEHYRAALDVEKSISAHPTQTRETERNKGMCCVG